MEPINRIWHTVRIISKERWRTSKRGIPLSGCQEAFGIPSETYYQWKEKLESGYYETPIKQERGRKTDKEALKQAAADRPDAFLKEYAGQSGCTATAVFYALKKPGKYVHLLRKIRRAPCGIYGTDKESFP